MKDGILFALVGWMIGLAIGSVISFATTTTLIRAQRQYIECIQVGAPKENCAKRYLLPKEPRT